jgi:hypothetical protein
MHEKRDGERGIIKNHKGILILENYKNVHHDPGHGVS